MTRNTDIRKSLFNVLGLATAILAASTGLPACNNPIAEAVKEIKTEAASPRMLVSESDGTALTSGATFNFGTASKTAAIDEVLTIKNTGASELVIDVDGIALSGAAPACFTVDAPASRLAPGATENLSLHFATLGFDTKTAILTIPTNDVKNRAYTLNLTGRGTTAEISSFKVAGTMTSPAATGIISGRDILVTLPFGITNRDLTPTIGVTGYVNPASGVRQDFTNPVTYTVTAIDGLSQIFYTVTVQNASNWAKDMTGFEFADLSPAVTATIDEANRMVSALLPYGSPASLVPSITHTGKSISPDTGVTTNFVSPVTYTITAEDGSTKNYTVTVKVRPQTPTFSSPIPGDGKVDLSWASADQAASYNLYWSTNAGVSAATGTKISIPSGTSYSHTGLSPNMTYYYVLTSVKADGTESDASVETNALTYPAAPSATTTAIAGGGELVLTWTAPATGANSYNIYYSTSSGVTKAGTKVSGIMGTSTTLTGLANWTPLYFKITAVNASGESAALSNEITGTPARQEIILVNSAGSVDFNFINPSTWARSQPAQPYFYTSRSVYSVAVDPDLKAVYVANNADYPGDITGYFGVGIYRPFDAASGSAPTYATGHQEGTRAEHVLAVTTPAGKKFLYTAYWSSNNVYLYTINNDGSLTVNGLVAPGFSSPRFLCADPAGKFLYISSIGSTGSAGVTACAINPDTGILSWVAGGTFAASSYTTGSAPFRMAIDPSGKYLYVVNNGSGTVSAFGIAGDGTLSTIGSYGVGSGPTGVAIDPSGTHVFVSNAFSASISVFSIGADGALSGKVDYPAVAETRPSCIAIDATGSYAVVTNGIAGSASVYAITPSTGALSGSKITWSTGAGPSHVIIVKLP